MDFTVITVSYNAEKTIAETINSVLSQQNISFEYLIIDGASKDNTANIVRNFTDSRINFTSEPDRGLYDAMNKGILKAKGKYIAILNSDDIYSDETVLYRVKMNFVQDNADIVYGNLAYFSDKDRKIKRRWRAVLPKCDKRFEALWTNGWQCPHPSTFVKKEVYDEVGTFKADYKISADYDFLVRTAVQHKKKFSYIDDVLVKMRLGGESTRGFKSIIEGNREVLKTWQSIDIKPSFTIIPRKLLYKVYFSISSR
ncbi:glycosyltransferase family 2 protein [Kistimonas scapharcae]|uniref:Glycosyltransferase family 2 protein n=2 Tax=Kistimonas scapharcae TaxID=1036133 RepID=A0ABP8UXI7_9GAMM